MKKSVVLLLALVLSITMLTVPSSAENLTANEARSILQKWLDVHPFESDAILALEHDEYSDDSGEYYLFSLDDPERYWLNFLVHKKTGELLFMMISDGEEPSIEIEPLDDWYKEYY